MIIFSISSKKIKTKKDKKKVELETKTGREKIILRVLEEKKLRNDTQYSFLKDSVNNNIFSFIPNLIYERIINNYKDAEKIFGESLLKKLTGYKKNYIAKNIMIPEFRKELRERVEDNINSLKNQGFIDEKFQLTEKAYDINSILLIKEEVDTIKRKLAGKNKKKEKDVYGDIIDVEPYKKGKKLSDVNIRKSIRMALKRQHKDLLLEDIMLNKRERRTKAELICLVDISGSMRGPKLETAKKAAIALAYKVIDDRNDIGFIAFSSKPLVIIEPTQNFFYIAKIIAGLSASGSTNIAIVLKKAIELFNKRKTKEPVLRGHIILISDTIPTTGKTPKEDLLDSAEACSNNNISVSIIGINLDKEAEDLAKKIVEITNGRLYKPRLLENLDLVVIEDYFSL